MRVTGRRKSTLAAAMVVGALVLAAGCMQTQEIDQTLPPYASISDEEPRSGQRAQASNRRTIPTAS